MDRDQRIKHINCDVDRFTVTKVSISIGVGVERLSGDVLADEVPLTSARTICPDDFDDVRMADTPECSYLAPDCLVAGSVVEELERSFDILDRVADAIDARETAGAKNGENLEATVDDVADGVVRRFGL